MGRRTGDHVASGSNRMKYNTKPIDFTGCHPVIAEHLKRGEAIECFVWDNPLYVDKRRLFVHFYNITAPCKYITEKNPYRYATPIARKTKRIMPPERAIPVLIAEGWRFNEYGNLVCPGEEISVSAFRYFGFPRDTPGADARFWPPCIIEEVEDDE